MGAMAYVRDAGGVPIPPSDLVAELRKRADAPNLDIVYCNASWRAIWRWREDDPRRQWIREGKYGEQDAYDVIGDAPPYLSIDDALGYFERSLRQYPREEVRKHADAIQRYNEVAVPQQQVAEVMNAVLGGNALDGVSKSENRVTVVSDIGARKKRGKR
jgi:hypothetical protein